jgi:hypothetical protein
LLLLLFVAPLCCTVVIVIVFSHDNNNNSLFAFFYDAMCLARKKQKLEISKEGKKGVFKVSKTHHTSTRSRSKKVIF